MQTGQALTALLGEGARLGPPAVVSLADSARPDELPAALDRAYQLRLEQRQAERRRAADVATLAQDIREQIAAVESLRATHDTQRRRALDAGGREAAADAAAKLAAASDQAAQLRGLLPGVTETEQQLSEENQRQQALVDAFRIRKEVLKATYTAALAERAVNEILSDPGQAADDASAAAGEADPAADDATGSGTDRLREIIAEMERELGPRPSRQGLMELRPVAPGAPEGSDIRIIFAVEPPGTALLIAVLDGPDAVRDRHDEAVWLAAEELQRVRHGQKPDQDRPDPDQYSPASSQQSQEPDPDPDHQNDEHGQESQELGQHSQPGQELGQHSQPGQELGQHSQESGQPGLGGPRDGEPEPTVYAFDSARSFLDEFFPDDTAEVEAGGAALIERNRARALLAGQRTRLGLTLEQVAERMGVPEEAVLAIEQADPSATGVRTLAAYVETLGGRLEIIADFGGERVALR
jgi:phage shock protein A